MMPRVAAGRAGMPAVGFVASGNLANDTIWILWNHLAGRDEIDCRIFTDGFVIGDLQAFQRPEPLEALLRDPRGLDALVLSIRSPGDTERMVLMRCREVGVPTVLILADCGSGAQKFIEKGAFVWPDRLCVADSVTLAQMTAAGAPAEILRPAGSPYLDYIERMAAAAKHGPKQDRVAYFCDVPNREDFMTWGKPIAFDERDVVRDLETAVRLRPAWKFVVRPHPKQLHAGLTPGLLAEDSCSRRPLHEVLSRYAICISTYSTALLVSVRLGVPAVSYQPNDTAKVREALYRAVGIPIVTTPQALACSLDTTPAPDSELMKSILFNPGAATHYLESLILETASSRQTAGTNRTAVPICRAN